MLWCACLLAYFGFLRVSEYTNPKQRIYKQTSRTLTMADVTQDDGNLRIHLKLSKTDQSKHGTTIPIGGNGTAMCPVIAFRKYVHARGCGAGPFFVWENGCFLTPNDVNKMLKQVLNAEMGGVYSSHSFRIGAASTSAANGYPNYVQQLGRWSSDAYLKYIRVSKKFVKQVSLNLANI